MTVSFSLAWRCAKGTRTSDQIADRLVKEDDRLTKWALVRARLFDQDEINTKKQQAR
jgi:hypothetical protein